ncbi:hypothetical protein ACWOFR_13685 [Carnobacterium gallinarum]|uniref:hypothetical protein n=1 Tax=Carnobacterium gallinarum TaxID=2749 RepID=UPI000550919D|nr:hypothetical protein [Carnobacterium gallinarum]
MKGLLGFSGINIKQSDYFAYKNSSNENFKELIKIFLESEAVSGFECILKKLENNDEDNEVEMNVQKNSDAPYGDKQLLKN